MKKQIFALGMAALMAAGCDAAVATAVNTAINNANQPQSSSSATPNATASASTGTNTTVTTGSDPFVAGRKWVYGLTTKAAMVNTTGEISIEVASTSGDEATIKTTATVAGVSTSNTTTVKRNSGNPWASLNLGASASTSGSATATSDETITVAAGTFACTKSTYASNQANATGTVDFWLNKDKGLIKEIVTIKPNVSASLPGAAAGLDLTTTTTIELKSVTP